MHFFCMSTLAFIKKGVINLQPLRPYQCCVRETTCFCPIKMFLQILRSFYILTQYPPLIWRRIECWPSIKTVSRFHEKIHNKMTHLPLHSTRIRKEDPSVIFNALQNERIRSRWVVRENPWRNPRRGDQFIINYTANLGRGDQQEALGKSGALCFREYLPSCGSRTKWGSQQTHFYPQQDRYVVPVIKFFKVYGKPVIKLLCQKTFWGFPKFFISKWRCFSEIERSFLKWVSYSWISITKKIAISKPGNQIKELTLRFLQFVLLLYIHYVIVCVKILFWLSLELRVKWFNPL